MSLRNGMDNLLQTFCKLDAGTGLSSNSHVIAAGGLAPTALQAISACCPTDMGCSLANISTSNGRTVIKTKSFLKRCLMLKSS